MKVLFIAPQPFFRDRGTPIRALRQIEELSRLGHSVDIACYPLGRDVDLPGVKIHRVICWPGLKDIKVGPSLAKFPLDLLLFFKVFLMCLKTRYDVIQAVEEGAFFGVWFKKLFGCRLIYNMDSHLTDQLKYSGFLTSGPLLWFAETLEKSAMRNAEYVVTVGSVLSEHVRSVAPGVKVLQLEDAPLDEVFRESPEGMTKLRSELGLGESPVALYTGNFSGYQGVPLLVRAAGFVAVKRPDIRVVIAGGEPREIEQMKKLAGEVGAERICIFAGKRPTQEMNTFMTLATVLLSPRIKGTNPPLKIYPYMQSGRVIVATRLSTHTQVLDDSCAILTEPEPESFANGILKAFDDKQVAVTLSNTARKRVESCYSLSIFKGKVRSTYEQIAASLSA
ncbi:MAG: glycosyltransferase [Kiritimatiellae bacterium]|nr:glycosyltransferase [Kiritimatiellia bacterium]